MSSPRRELTSAAASELPAIAEDDDGEIATIGAIHTQVCGLESTVKRHMRQQQIQVDRLKVELRSAIEVFFSFVAKADPQMSGLTQCTLKKDTPYSSTESPVFCDAEQGLGIESHMVEADESLSNSMADIGRLVASQADDTSRIVSACVDDLLVRIRKESEERIQFEATVQETEKVFEEKHLQVSQKMRSLLDQFEALRSWESIQRGALEERFSEDIRALGSELDKKADTALANIRMSIVPIEEASHMLVTKLQAAEDARWKDMSCIGVIEEKVTRLGDRIVAFERHGQDSNNRAATSTCNLAARMELLSTSLEKVAANAEVQCEKMKALKLRVDLAEEAAEKAERMSRGMVTLSELRDILNRERSQRKEELPTLFESLIMEQGVSVASLQKRMQVELSIIREELGLSARTLTSKEHDADSAYWTAVSERASLDEAGLPEQVGALTRLQQTMMNQVQREVTARQDSESRIIGRSRLPLSRSPSREDSLTLSHPHAAEKIIHEMSEAGAARILPRSALAEGGTEGVLEVASSHGLHKALPSSKSGSRSGSRDTPRGPPANLKRESSSRRCLRECLVNGSVSPLELPVKVYPTIRSSGSCSPPREAASDTHRQPQQPPTVVRQSSQQSPSHGRNAESTSEPTGQQQPMTRQTTGRKSPGRSRYMEVAPRVVGPPSIALGIDRSGSHRWSVKKDSSRPGMQR